MRANLKYMKTNLKSNEVDSVIFTNSQNENLSNGMIGGSLGAVLAGALIAVIGIFIRKDEFYHVDEEDEDYAYVSTDDIQELHARVID